MDYQQQLQRLGNALGVDNLTFSKELTARLIFGEGLVVDLEWNEQTQVLDAYSGLGAAPLGNASLLAEMLSANLFGQATNGAVLAIEPQQKEAILFQAFELSSEQIDQIAAQFHTFAQTVEDWTERLAGVSPHEEVFPEAPLEVPEMIRP